MFNGLPMTFTNPQQAARWDSFPGFGGTPAPSTRGTDAYVPANTHGASGRNYGMPGAPAPAPVPAPAPQPGGSGYGGQPMNYVTPAGGVPPMSPQPLMAQVAGGQPVDWQSMLTNMFGSMPQGYAQQPGGVIQGVQQGMQPQQGKIASFMANPAMQKFLPPQTMQAFAGGVQFPQFRRATMAPSYPGVSTLPAMLKAPQGTAVGNTPQFSPVQNPNTVQQRYPGLVAL